MMMYVRLITVTFLFFVSAHHANAVLFSTRYVEGSTCLHHMDTGLPFRFDTGQVNLSTANQSAVNLSTANLSTANQPAVNLYSEFAF